MNSELSAVGPLFTTLKLHPVKVRDVLSPGRVTDRLVNARSALSPVVEMTTLSSRIGDQSEP